MIKTVPETVLLGVIEGGGSWTRCALATEDGTIHTRAQHPTTSPEATLQRVQDFFAGVPITALGVGFFGPLERDTGAIGATPKPGWSGIQLRERLQSRLGVPVALETDVIAAAIGEHWRGAGRDARSLLYLTVGTGIGGGLLHDGRPVGGRHHPEVGHMAVPVLDDDTGFVGVCPFHTDCLEGRASGPALAARWGMPGERLPASHPGWDLQARYLALGIRNLVAICAPDTVIVGGGLGRSTALQAPLRMHLARELERYWPGIDLGTLLRAPGLGADSALVGAARLALHVKKRKQSYQDG